MNADFFAYVTYAVLAAVGLYTSIGGFFAVRSYVRRRENIRRALDDQDLLPPL